MFAHAVQGMSSRDTGPHSISPPAILSEVPDEEIALHREFIYRNVDFLVDTLTAEQANQHWYKPAGCPSATPAALARRRQSDEKFPCRYQTLTTIHGSLAPGAPCNCGDLLAGTDAILDTVAAVAISCDDSTPGQRYFDLEDRQLISDLRSEVGNWDEIAALDTTALRAALESATNRLGISEGRIERLEGLLDSIASYGKTEGVSLTGISGLRYESFCDTLADFPGISRSDAWWLLLVAFDKPVWPADPFIDGLLCSLGLLDVSQFNKDVERRKEIEEKLTDRQIGTLHRALAGHAVKGQIDTCNETCEIRKFLLTYRHRQQQKHSNGPVIIDLFSGAGGISVGFKRAGCSVEWAIDKNQNATDTYRLNHPEIPHRNVVCQDIRDAIEAEAIKDIERRPDIMVGGPPCQSLSYAGYRSRLADDDEYTVLEDERTSLYTQYVEFVEELRPKALVIENVVGMVNELEETGIKVGDLVLDAIASIGDEKVGYTCDYQLIDCSTAGLPQERKRVIIIGIRNDLVKGEQDIHELFHRITEDSSSNYTLRDALSGVPKLKRGEGGRVVKGQLRGNRSSYVKENNLEAGTNLYFNHKARSHPMEKDRTLFDEAMEPGDTSWDVKYAKDGEYSELIEYDVGTADNPRFKDKYRMLSWDEPSPTVVAHLAKDANNFILPDYYEHVSDSSHRDPNPKRNRGITPREAARLQSFPDEYIFLGPFTSWFRQIGNAIPPLFGERIANVLSDYLTERTAEKLQVTGQQQSQASSDD